MPIEELFANFLNENLVYLLLAFFIVVCILAGVRIVPQSEKYVVERLVEAVCSLKYPKDLLEIQVLDDSTDETSEIVAKQIETLQKKGISITHVQRKDRKGFKAGALDHAMEFCEGEFIAIFDADFLMTCLRNVQRINMSSLVTAVPPGYACRIIIKIANQN